MNVRHISSYYVELPPYQYERNIVMFLLETI